MMLYVKILLLSTVFLSAGMMLRVSVPVIADFAVYEVPVIYNAVVSWLRPPYLYLVINCIIITIVASSMMHSSKDYDVSAPPLDAAVHVQPQLMSGKGVDEDEYKYKDSVLDDTGEYDDLKVEKQRDFDGYGDVEPIVNRRLEEEAPIANVAAVVGNIVFEEDAASNKENECVSSKSQWNALDRNDSNPSDNTRSPLSARFGHRRSLKASPEGGGSRAVLGVSKSKKHETLESTWKTITEGRSMPLNRHLKKNETWERNPSPKAIMSKSETFHERTNTRSQLTRNSPSSPGGSGKLKKEPSLSQDELNRRVEAFIKKFNEEMRLQRQESLNQYVQMVKRDT